MSEKPSEYLKRTCLICGCHTNQTINIYEPRSGPNIVQLIQAKFKFQPLNEDKYLCFSCNNWLINWHSLQALNSNEADASGTFRSHISGGSSGSSNVMQDRASEEPQTPILRPVAAVRPFQLDQNSVAEQQQQQPQPQQDQLQQQRPICESKVAELLDLCETTEPVEKYQSFKATTSAGGFGKKPKPFRLAQPLRRGPQPKCLPPPSPCRQLVSDRRRRVLVDKENRLQAAVLPALGQHLVNCSPSAPLEGLSHSQRRHNHLAAPRVDGKVVAMLRRLGTTLSRENPHKNNNNNSSSSNGRTATPPLPPIMSPTTPKPRWWRPLDDDEMLVDFDTAISEALPLLDKQLRRQLPYRMTAEELANEHADDSGDDERGEVIAVCDEDNGVTSVAARTEATNVEAPPCILHTLPQGLSVTLQ